MRIPLGNREPNKLCLSPYIFTCKLFHLLCNFTINRSSSKIFGSDGNELWSYDGCHYETVKGDIVEVPFDGSEFLTLKLHTEHEGSQVISEFVLLEQGKVLYSGIVEDRQLFSCK